MKADGRSSALPQGSFGGIPRMTEDEAGLASPSVAKLELANRLFFRLYQCANMLHKTGSRAVEGDGRLAVAPDERDRRSRIVTMTASGRHVWHALALPKIHAYYGRVLADFSINDSAHMLHYLLKLLDNMRAIDAPPAGEEEEEAAASAGGAETGA